MLDTYLTTDELSARIKYDPRTIRERLKDSVLIEGIHYFRPFGGRKILYIWEAIEKDMFNKARTNELTSFENIPNPINQEGTRLCSNIFLRHGLMK